VDVLQAINEHNPTVVHFSGHGSDAEYLYGLLKELLALPKETEWLEFKENNDNPQEIGEYISALSNSAALGGKAFAYLVWGVNDDTRQIVGTSFKPKSAKKGGEELESRLLRLMNPRIDFRFHGFETDKGNVVILEISRALKHPVQFQGQEYIRVGSFKKPLKEFPEKERALWRIFDTTPFEDMIARENQSSDDVLLRKEVPMYPELAIRELVANAIIHQDFLIHGAGPMVEIFVDRIEITNPGAPIVKTERFLDSPPRSRNEGVASFMRRIGYCEERGSGIDKVVSLTEHYQLPAPLFEVVEDNTRAVLFAYRPYAEMDRKERVLATYMHACLRYVQRDYLTNSSLRERFGIEKENSAMVSRVIRDALEDGAIKPVDPESESRKLARYWPTWA
jgi:predicted HTH transcriptional regulator